MNVLFISNDRTIFNEKSATRKRMRAYASAIGTLHIISAAPKGTPPITHEEVPNGILTLHAVSGRKPFSLFTMRLQARRIVRKENIEIVSTQDPFEYGWIGVQVVRGTSAKLHVQIHTDFLSPWFTSTESLRIKSSHVPALNKMRVKLAARVLPQAHGIRVVSKRIADSVAEHFKNRIVPPVIIPLTVPADVPPRIELPPYTCTFLFIAVSRLEPEKRIGDILFALAQLIPHYPSAGLVIIGEGSERMRLERLVRELSLEEHVMFLGERLDAWGLLQSAHVFVQASAYEGYGRTLIEAALARIPIITTDVGIVGEVFRGYQDVLAVPVSDTTVLGMHMVRLIQDNTARKELIDSAERTAREHLACVHTGPDAIAQDLRNLLMK